LVVDLPAPVLAEAAAQAGHRAPGFLHLVGPLLQLRIPDLAHGREALAGAGTVDGVQSRAAAGRGAEAGQQPAGLLVDDGAVAAAADEGAADLLQRLRRQRIAE